MSEAFRMIKFWVLVNAVNASLSNGNERTDGAANNFRLLPESQKFEFENQVHVFKIRQTTENPLEMEISPPSVEAVAADTIREA